MNQGPHYNSQSEALNDADRELCVSCGGQGSKEVTNFNFWRWDYDTYTRKCGICKGTGYLKKSWWRRLFER